MKKLSGVALAIGAVLTVGMLLGAMFIAQNAGLVSAALQQLKFEELPGNPKLIGAPPQLKVTKETIDFLVKIQKDGKLVEVENDGSLKIK
jgi:hypothetical protein